MDKPAASSSTERRHFFRVNFKTPVEFLTIRANRLGLTKNRLNGASKNISESGILFNTTDPAPEIASILWMSLDMRTLRMCQEIEARALMVKNGVLGKVVRVEDRGDEVAVGVCFLTQDQKETQEVRKIISRLNQELP